jgi:hypothetical protein
MTCHTTGTIHNHQTQFNQKVNPQMFFTKMFAGVGKKTKGG